jgi:alpha-beta hydrolase superfamily lysophospholipase
MNRKVHWLYKSLIALTAIALNSEARGAFAAQPLPGTNSGAAPEATAARITAGPVSGATAGSALGRADSGPGSAAGASPGTAPGAVSASTPPTTAGASASVVHHKAASRGNAPCLRWAESGVSPRAAILCIHGLGLHNGSYQDFGKRMAKLGYVVYAVDMRGFGSYKDAEGKEQVDFDGCMADIQSTLKVLRRAHPQLPIYILGESMGGAIALHATAKFPDLIDGLVSSVPAGERFKSKKSSMNVALHAIEGGFNKPFDIGTSVIKQATEKPELREAWGNDPLNRLELSPRELMIFQHFMDQNHEAAPLIKDKPVLMVQGCLDKLVKPEGTVELFNELGSTDRRIQLIEHGEHLIFEESQCSDAALDALTNWLDLHILTYQLQHGQKQLNAG